MALKPLSQYNEQLIQQFREQLSVLEKSGQQSTREDPALVARRLTNVIPRETSVWNDKIGPFFTADGVVTLLGITKQAVSKQADAGKLLRLRTPDHRTVYPTFQFREDGVSLPHLASVLHALERGVNDPWTWALWLNTPTRTFDGRSAVEMLWAGSVPEVVAAAEHAAASWAA